MASHPAELMVMAARVGLKNLQELLERDGKHYKEPICGGLVRTKDSLEIQAVPFFKHTQNKIYEKIIMCPSRTNYHAQLIRSA